MQQQGYDRWRATIPWTDDQIVNELIECSIRQPVDFLKVRLRLDANFIATTGRLSGRILSKVLPGLIKVCEFCQKPALYRYGVRGRCAMHRDRRPGYVAVNEESRVLRSSDRAEGKRLSDYHKLGGSTGRLRPKFHEVKSAISSRGMRSRAKAAKA